MTDARLPSHIKRMQIEADGDSRRWFPETADNLPFMVLAMCGEAGELANIVKKVARGDMSLRDAKTRMAACMEVTDVFTYLLDIAELLNFDLEKAYYVKRAENQRRFGTGAGGGTAGQNGSVLPGTSSNAGGKA